MRQDALPLRHQLDRLVADVLEHPVEAREVAANALVAVVGVRLRRQVGRDLDHDLLVEDLERGLDPALGEQVEQPRTTSTFGRSPAAR